MPGKGGCTPPLWADTSENNLSATTVADGNNSKHRTEVALADQEGGYAPPLAGIRH